MAEKKKTTAVTPAKKTRSGAASEEGRSRRKKTDTAADVDPGMTAQLAPYGLIVLAVLLSICLLGGDETGIVGGAIQRFFTGAVGGAAFFLPVFIVAELVMWQQDQMYGRLRGKFVCYAAVLLLLAVLFHLFVGGEDGFSAAVHLENGQMLVGGGVLGGLLGTLLVKGFGKVSTSIAVISAVVLLGLYLFGMTPRGLWLTIRYRMERAKERRAELEEERRAYESDYRMRRNRMREEEYAAYLKAKKLEEKKERERAKIERGVEKEERRMNLVNEYADPEREEPFVDLGAEYLDDPAEPFPEEKPASKTQKGKKSAGRPAADKSVPGGPVPDKSVPGGPAADKSVPGGPVPGEAVHDTKKEESLASGKRSVDAAGEEPAFGDVDQRIFDEVMRRTRERIEKNRVAAGLQTAALETEGDASPSPEAVRPAVSSVDSTSGDISSDGREDVDLTNDDSSLPHPWDKEPNGASENGGFAADDFLDEDFFTDEREGDSFEREMDEYATLSRFIGGIEPSGANRREPKEQAKAGSAAPPTVESVAPEETDTVKVARELSEEDGLDLAGLFVNPDDAALLDRLSAAYLKAPGEPASEALAIERTDVGSAADEVPAEAAVKAPEYVFPPMDILTEDTEDHDDAAVKEELQENAVKLVETLKSFNVRTKIEDISRGPTITRYELLPEPGTRVRSITNLVDDIALNLATTGVRIEAPIPGKSAVGIEVPNKTQRTVHLRTLIEMETFQSAKSRLTVCLGENVAGEAVYFDIAKMPHLLIAGATGMGKSVCINSLITSLLYKAKPDEVKLILIDPKKVELSIYNGIPHLIVPVVSEPKKAAGALAWAVNEMERRFGLIEEVGVRDIRMFNEVTKDDPDYESMPQVVIVIDELADLMMTAPDDVEDSICRLAQKARAAGMHLIIGTQRPSVDVITGLIKANIPSRIAFTVSSQVDSRTIIDKAGAENLIGRGDMLFNPVGASKPMRVQGAYVSETDVEEVVSYIKNMNSESSFYSAEVQEQIDREAARCGVGKKGAAAKEDLDGEGEDSMLRAAIELAIESGKISTSLIQRRLALGYGRAAKLIDRMEQLGYVSPPDGGKARKVLISREEFMELTMNQDVS